MHADLRTLADRRHAWEGAGGELRAGGVERSPVSAHLVHVGRQRALDSLGRGKDDVGIASGPLGIDSTLRVGVGGGGGDVQAEVEAVHSGVVGLVGSTSPVLARSGASRQQPWCWGTIPHPQLPSAPPGFRPEGSWRGGCPWRSCLAAGSAGAPTAPHHTCTAGEGRAGTHV